MGEGGAVGRTHGWSGDGGGSVGVEEGCQWG